MKKSFTFVIFLVSALVSFAGQNDDFDEQKICSQVKDYPIDSINLSTPLDYYLSRAWGQAYR